MVTIVESIQLVFTDGTRTRVKNTIALPVVVKDLEAFRKKVYHYYTLAPGKPLKHVNLTYTQTKYGFSYDFNRQ